MKQRIPVGVVVAVICLALAAVALFGWRFVTGGPNADVTDINIKRYQDAKNAMMAHRASNPAEASKAGAPMSAAPPVGSPGGGHPGAPMAGAPMGGAPMGGAPAGR